jgi:outer membrane lipoprotein-sorting protein
MLVLALAGNACQRSDPNANTNLTNVNSSPVIANANLSPEPASVIAAREPEKYRATLVFSAETEGGQKTVGIPTLSAEVARNGADRRVSFKLPDGSDLIYLEQAGKHIVIAPGRKQYAELTPEATGFQLQRLMTPGQLVAHLEKLRGVERVGEETMNGRNADKYRYATTTNTSTAAGQVSTEAFVYVDKETGLPLRSELYTEASGNVQGVKGAKIVAEMRDVTTTVDESLFQIPAGLNKVPPEQVRSQIDAITNTVAAVIKALLSNMTAPPSATTASPALMASPAISPSPRASY